MGVHRWGLTISLAAAVTPVGAVAAPLPTPALLAAPSVVRIETQITADALRDREGRVITLTPAAGHLALVGVAFVVSPDGVVATAAHTAAPDGIEVARRLWTQHQAARGVLVDAATAERVVRQRGLTPMGARVRMLRAWPVVPDGRGSPVGRVVVSTPVAVDRVADLALMRVPSLEGAPALPVSGGVTLGTPVWIVKVASAALTPRAPQVVATRLGAVMSLGRDGPAVASALDGPFAVGDSGAPVVDADGVVHGMVWRRQASGNGGYMIHAERLRALATRAGLASAPGAAGEQFRRAVTEAAIAPDVAAGARTRARQLYPANPWLDEAARPAMAASTGESHRTWALVLAGLCTAGAAGCLVRVRYLATRAPSGSTRRARVPAGTAGGR